MLQKKPDFLEIVLALCLIISLVAFFLGHAAWQPVSWFGGLLVAKIVPSGLWNKPWPPEVQFPNKQ